MQDTIELINAVSSLAQAGGVILGIMGGGWAAIGINRNQARRYASDRVGNAFGEAGRALIVEMIREATDGDGRPVDLRAAAKRALDAGLSDLSDNIRSDLALRGINPESVQGTVEMTEKLVRTAKAAMQGDGVRNVKALVQNAQQAQRMVSQITSALDALRGK